MGVDFAAEEEGRFLSGRFLVLGVSGLSMILGIVLESVVGPEVSSVSSFSSRLSQLRMDRREHGFRVRGLTRGEDRFFNFVGAELREAIRRGALGVAC